MKKLFLIIFVGLFCAMSPTQATSLVVTATICKYTRLSVVSQPSSVMVTVDDIVRGYVDAPVSVAATVRSNVLSGYLVEFSTNSDFVDQTVVQGLAVPVQFGPNGGSARQPGLVGTASLNLWFRFVLSAKTRPGTYPWPVQISAANI